MGFASSIETASQAAWQPVDERCEMTVAYHIIDEIPTTMDMIRYLIYPSRTTRLMAFSLAGPEKKARVGRKRTAKSAKPRSTCVHVDWDLSRLQAGEGEPKTLGRMGLSA